jgi:hypothetical protein
MMTGNRITKADFRDTFECYLLTGVDTYQDNRGRYRWFYVAGFGDKEREPDPRSYHDPRSALRAAIAWGENNAHRRAWALHDTREWMKYNNYVMV